MKVLFVALLVVASTYAASFNNKKIQAAGPECPLPAEIQIPASLLNLTFGDENTNGALIIRIDEPSKQDGGVATGLHGLSYVVEIDPLFMRFAFDGGISGEVCVRGSNYEATGLLDLSPFTAAVFPSGSFAGAGTYEACITNPVIGGEGKIDLVLIGGYVKLEELELDQLVFDSVNVNLQGMKVNDADVNWAEWNAAFKQNFEAEWPIHGADFTERVRAAISFILEQFTLEELIEIISGGGGGGEPCTPTN